MPGLCSIGDVKIRHRIAESDTRWDALITQWIDSASATVEEHCGGRQFLPDVAASIRVFSGGGGRFVPVDDLSAPPTLVELVDPTGAVAGDITTAAVPSPRNRREAWRPIRGLWFRGRTIPREWEVHVTGVWGCPETPPQAKEAVIETVRDWLRDAQSYTNQHADIEGLTDGALSRGIPPRARELLARLNDDPVGV